MLLLQRTWRVFKRISRLRITKKSYVNVNLKMKSHSLNIPKRSRCALLCLNINTCTPQRFFHILFMVSKLIKMSFEYNANICRYTYFGTMAYFCVYALKYKYIYCINLWLSFHRPSVMSDFLWCWAVGGGYKH